MAKASLFMKQSCMKNFFVELCFSQRFHPRRCALEPVFKSLLFKSSFCKQVWMSSCKPNFDSPHYWSSFIRKLVIFHTCFPKNQFIKFRSKVDYRSEERRVGKE